MSALAGAPLPSRSRRPQRQIRKAGVRLNPVLLPQPSTPTCPAAPAPPDTPCQIREAGVRALALQGDVKDRPAVERAVEQAAGELGGPHILMANAGGHWGGVPGWPGGLSGCC